VCRKAVLLLWAAASVLFLAATAAPAFASTFAVSPTLNFELTAYNTTVGFSSTAYMTSLTYTYSNNIYNVTSITFQNVYMDGNTLPSWEATVQNANLTVTSFFKNGHLKFTLDAPSGTSTATVSAGTYGEPVAVSGASSWSYDEATKKVTVNAAHNSPAQIDIQFSTVTSGMLSSAQILASVLSIVALMVGVAIIVQSFRENGDDSFFTVGTKELLAVLMVIVVICILLQLFSSWGV